MLEKIVALVKLLGRELSEEELRTLKIACNNYSVFNTHLKGGDVYRTIAALYYNVKEEEVTKEMRTKVKEYLFILTYSNNNLKEEWNCTCNCDKITIKALVEKGVYIKDEGVDKFSGTYLFARKKFLEITGSKYEGKINVYFGGGIRPSCLIEDCTSLKAFTDFINSLDNIK